MEVNEMEKSHVKKLYTLLSKMTNLFTSFYVMKPSYVITKNNEKPFLVELTEDYMELLKELFGDFEILFVHDIKVLKKVLNGPKEKDDLSKFPKLEDQFYVVTNPRETFELRALLGDRLESIKNKDKWESFLLSDDETTHEELVKSIFIDNNYVNFKPKGEIDSPLLILTKALLPLVTEKNCSDLYYAVQEIIEGKLYQIVFDFQHDLFRLYMYHNYIPIEVVS